MEKNTNLYFLHYTGIFIKNKDPKKWQTPHAEQIEATVKVNKLRVDAKGRQELF